VLFMQIILSSRRRSASGKRAIWRAKGKWFRKASEKWSFIHSRPYSLYRQVWPLPHKSIDNSSPTVDTDTNADPRVTLD